MVERTRAERAVFNVETKQLGEQFPSTSEELDRFHLAISDEENNLACGSFDPHGIQIGPPMQRM